MELFTIPQAAEKASVSDKTLRRAISEGALKVQPKLHNNSKIMISAEQLAAYIASRHPLSTDDQARTDDHMELIAAMQQQIDALLLRVAELESLEHRVQALEKMVLSLAPAHDETEVPTSENGTLGHVQTVTKRRTTKQQEPTFELADFSKKWQDTYVCKASLKTINATFRLSPHVAQGTNGEIYQIDYLDSRTGKRNPSDELIEQARALKNALNQKAIEAMQQAGWKEVGTTDIGKILNKQPD